MNSRGPIHADRPIESRTEDALGRKHFAEYLARSISSWNQNESLVIALWGPWGGGKTSVKNMMIEALRSEKREHPIRIVDFNPWQFSHHRALTSVFFTELASILGRSEGKDTKKLAKLLDEMGVYLKGGYEILSSLTQLFGVFAIVGVALMATANLITADLAKKIVFAIGSLITLTGAALAFPNRITRTFRDIVEAKLRRNQKPLEDRREELRQAMSKELSPAVVVLDDLDRLTSEELREVFQLVKANADFPNLVYFLIADRAVIERLLNKEHFDKGREYIDKIVQVGFDLPAVSQRAVEAVLFKELDELLESFDSDRHFDNQRWANFYIGGVRGLFHSLRDVKRFLSGMAFHFGLMTSEKLLEVNPIDLIIMEAIRTFEPEVYNAIRREKEFLTHSPKRYDKPTKEVSEAATERVLLLASEANKTSVSEIMKRLFYKPGGGLSGTYIDGGPDDWARERRIASADSFDLYFRLTVGDQDLSESQVHDLLSKLNDRSSFRDTLLRLEEKDLLIPALEHVRLNASTIDEKDIITAISAIYDLGESIEYGTREAFNLGIEWNINFAVKALLGRAEDASVRSEHLLAAIKGTTGLYLPAHRLSMEREVLKKTPREGGTLTKNDFEEAREVVSGRIRDAANSGALLLHRKMLAILFRWGNFRGLDEPKKWVAELLDTGKVLPFLAHFVDVVQSVQLGDRAARRLTAFRFHDLVKLVEPDVVNAAIAKLSGDRTLAEEDALKGFKESWNASKAGKMDPDEPYLFRSVGLP